MQAGYYPTPHHEVPRDPMGKAFLGSLLTHGLVAGVLVASGLLNLAKNNFGSQATSTGSVGVDLVKTIPIPRSEGRTNPLANDTKSIAPQAPPQQLKLKQQVKEEPKDAIPIPDKVEKKKKVSPQQQVTSLFRLPEQYKSNQVYSSVPQQVSSPMYATQGSNGIDVGKESILGSQYGAYADLIRDRISQHWNRAGLHSSPSQKCSISFVIGRDGTVSNVQVSQASGDYLLDTSAKRAVLDANPLPSLPPQFPRNEATVEFTFQLRQ